MASKHRSIGVGLQSLGLRIAAFDAYIVKSEKEERSKLRGELARTFFEERRKQDALSPDELSLTTKVVDRLSGVVEKAVDKALSATGTKSEQ